MGGQPTDRPKTRNGETSPFTCKEARPANGHPPANFRGELASTFFVLCERSETARAQREGKSEGRKEIGGSDRDHERTPRPLERAPSAVQLSSSSFPVPTLALASLWRRAEGGKP